MHRFLLALALAIPLSSIPAQTLATRVVPAGYEFADGSSSTPYFGGYGAGIAQQVVLGSALCPNIAVLSAIDLRCDAGRATPPIPARSFTQVTLKVGPTAATPASMSRTFAQNRTAPLTTVFSGALNLPAQPAGSRAFDIPVVFSQNYIYQRTAGNLLLEFDVPGQPAKSNYFFDTHSAATAGDVTIWGTSGRTGGNLGPKFSVSSPTLGSTVNVTTRAGSLSTAALFFLGSSNQSFQGVPLPFDLGVVGGNGNFLHVAPELVSAMAMTNGTATLSIPIPNNPWLSGQTLYLQGAIGDSTANALGLVMTQGAAMTIGSFPAPVQLLGTYLNTRPTGSMSSRPTGLVIRFRGVFG